MYAVIKTGGKQYRVKAGDLMVVEKVDGAPGDVVSFDQVLALGEGESVTLGAPLVDGAAVSATLIETRKGEKVKIFKKIRRQGYRRTRGHRQFESVLRVTGINGAGLSAAWDGVVDLTTKAELNLRARGLADTARGEAAQVDEETLEAVVDAGVVDQQAVAEVAEAQAEAKPAPKKRASKKAAAEDTTSEASATDAADGEA